MAKKSDPRYAKTIDAEKFIDQKLEKQREADNAVQTRQEETKKVKPKKPNHLGAKYGRFWRFLK
jgi:hypothetical protein